MIIRPSLRADFANSRQLPLGAYLVDDFPAAGMSYFDAIGVMRFAAVSEPRFDHHPSTGLCRGLLLEPARINRLARSETLTGWTVANASLSSPSVSTPKGTAAAILFNPSSTTIAPTASASISTPVATVVFSVYAKNAGLGQNHLMLQFNNAVDGARGTTYFNLLSGEVMSGDGGIEPVGSGWHRCWVTANTTRSTDSVRVSLTRPEGYVNASGQAGVYLYMMQAEDGALPSSYIPTAGQAAGFNENRRLAFGTDSVWGKWYNSNGGTIFLDVEAQAGQRIATMGGVEINAQAGVTRYAVSHGAQPAAQLQLGFGRWRSIAYYPRVLPEQILERMRD